MHESPDFKRQQAQRTVPERPLVHAFRDQRPGIARSFAISALGSITYYVGITYFPAFLTSVGSANEERSLWISTAAAFAVIVVTPFVGLLSDRVGRKPVLLTLALSSVVFPIWLFSLAAESPGGALLGALIMASIAGAVSAVGAVATAEQFTGEGRVSGLALGATLATALFGGLTPYLAQVLVEQTGRPQVPGIMIALVALAVAPVFLAMRETRP
jgi:MHS family proline/betaine transporter-like MFS transporter